MKTVSELLERNILSLEAIETHMTMAVAGDVINAADAATLSAQAVEREILAMRNRTIRNR
jgi:hypothetical protein